MKQRLSEIIIILKHKIMIIKIGLLMLSGKAKINEVEIEETLDKLRSINISKRIKPHYLDSFVDSIDKKYIEISRTTIKDLYTLDLHLKSLSNIKGDIAEVGSSKGGSAMVLSRAKGNKTLHLFDVFDESKFCSLEQIKSNLKDEENIIFNKGIFPGTAANLKNKTFSFVNIDADSNGTTLDCLNFFYPRMVKDGKIIIHDYVIFDGVRKACKEYMKDKEEEIIEVGDCQGLIIKK